MTDPTAAAVPPSDGLEFVPNGVIRFHFGPDQVVRVRRPFFGELKDLRLALAEVQDETAPTTTRAVAVGRALADRSAQAQSDLEAGTLDPQAFAETTAAIRAEDRKVANEVEVQREQLMLQWWAKVFGKLALDAVPDAPEEYPAWIMDAQLPTRVLTHWRTVPSGPG